MHDEILIEKQKNQTVLLKKFSKSFGLVGGTAVALHVGHRRSIDFDLFSSKAFTASSIRKTISDFSIIDKELSKLDGEYTLMVNGVKWTFFQFPYDIPFEEKYNNLIMMPSLLTLAAMKAFALGGRAKWKDYVDMFFIMNEFHSLDEIVEQAEKIFGHIFNEKLFRQQLAYFEDINYSESIEYMPKFEVDDEEIKRKLIEYSLS